MTPDELDAKIRNAEAVIACRHELDWLDSLAKTWTDFSHPWRLRLSKNRDTIAESPALDGFRFDYDTAPLIADLVPGVAAAVLERIKTRREEVLKRLEELA